MLSLRDASAERDLANWIKRRLQRELGKTRDSGLSIAVSLAERKFGAANCGVRRLLGLFTH
jgi:hypothetical protein